MKKVLILTYYWPPSGGGGVQRWLKLSKYLSDFSIEPIVLTVDEKYASYPHIDNMFEAEASKIRCYRTKSFEALKFYERLVGKKNVPHSAFANVNKKSFLQRVSRFIRGNLLIPDPRKGWNKYALQKARQLIKEENISCVITTSPPHSTQLIGLKLKEEFKLHWIADLRDPWTDIFYYEDLLHLPFNKKKDKAYELRVLQGADSIVTVSDSIKKLFMAKADGIGNKIHIIPNGYDPEDFKNPLESNNEVFTFSYIGSLTEDYAPEILFVELGKLIDIFKFNLRFVGNVSPAVRDQIKNNNLEERTVYRDRVNHDEAVKEMQRADALLLFIPRVENNEGILTGKIFEYIASQKPIIGVGPQHGDAAKILDEFRNSQMFDYSSPELKKFLQSILSSPAKSNDEDSLKYSRRNQAKEIARIIDEF